MKIYFKIVKNELCNSWRIEEETQDGRTIVRSPYDTYEIARNAEIDLIKYDENIPVERKI